MYGTCRETWEQFREHFREALNRRINAKGGLPMQGRRWDQDWYWAARRDQERLQKRIYTRRFETDVVRARFAHREHGDDD